jgi:hypothetical protein
MRSSFTPMDVADIYALYANQTPVGSHPSDLADRPPSQALPVPRVMGARKKPSHSYRRDNALSPFEQYAPQPYEDQFTAPAPVRQRSAKELINRFEALAGAETYTFDEPFTPPRQADLEVPLKEETKTSPLRQSLRNLMSVFKKGHKSLKDKDGALSTYLQPTKDVSLGEEFVNKAPGSQFCTSPAYALRSGKVLYLQRSDAVSGIFPVWSEYEGFLHSTHLLLSHKTADGVPSTHVLSLTACTDVHSVSVRALPAEERALMPSVKETWTTNVFDIVFDGKPLERFAVASAKERSAWVGAIW